MSGHTHEGSQLTFGCPACIEVARPTEMIYIDGYADMSAGRRLTARNNADIERGVHPATHRPLLHGVTCGECANHVAINHHSGTFHKCRVSLLGLSHSASSDIRVSWPACELFEAVS